MGKAVDGVAIERLEEDRFTALWPLIAEELDAVPHLWAQWWTKEVIHDLTAAGAFQCWAAGFEDEIHLIVFTQVMSYPAGNFLSVFLAFGNRLDDMLLGLMDTLEEFAVRHHCKASEVVDARGGWQRKLRPYGFKVSTTVLSRSVGWKQLN